MLLLDEPSASVDPTSRRMLWKLLRQLADSGKSILISTHVKVFVIELEFDWIIGLVRYLVDFCAVRSGIIAKTLG